MSDNDCNKRGRISKLVRVPIKSKWDDQQGTLHGYGILQSEDGRDVLFETDVIVDARFEDLEVGDQVIFDIEQGPFARAATVRLLSQATHSLTTATTSPLNN